MNTEKAIERARQKIAAGIEAERAYCVASQRAKYVATDETCALLETAEKTFHAARNAVKTLYKKRGLVAPKMPTIFMVELYFNQLQKND